MLIAVAKVKSTHGIKGFLKIAAFSGSSETIASQREVMLGAGEMDVKTFRLESVKPTTGDTMLVKLEGIDSIDEADILKGLTVFVPAQNLPALPALTYYSFQLEGCNVFFEDGQNIGVVHRVENLPANDVLFVKRPDGTEVLVPAIKDIIKNIDVIGRRIIIENRKGLV